MNQSVIDRFWKYTFPEPMSGCWLWTGPVTTRKKGLPYGGLLKHDAGKITNLSAHKIAYELHGGPIPAGLCVDHLCRNTLCVNPEHLEAVTTRENLRRGVGTSSSLRKKVCRNGHLLEETNLYYYSNGRRVCKQCFKMWQAKRRKRIG